MFQIFKSVAGVSRRRFVLRVVLPCTLGASLLSFTATAGLEPHASVTLGWNPSPDLTVVGYRLYYGTSSSSLSSITTIGLGTQVTVGGLTPGQMYYFAVRSYNLLGLESIDSNEI